MIIANFKGSQKIHFIISCSSDAVYSTTTRFTASSVVNNVLDPHHGAKVSHGDLVEAEQERTILEISGTIGLFLAISTYLGTICVSTTVQDRV